MLDSGTRARKKKKIPKEIILYFENRRTAQIRTAISNNRLQKVGHSKILLETW
ncbi:MAG: hypothetical protein KGJ61_10345 [Candidatus Omnitrophica bacterium]|nr:hypothetical protein [Candidatus Omnitrophota bacterium]